MAQRIMMVDDSKTTRDMVRFVLKRAGYDVLVAEDGEAALRVLDGALVDCVITDLKMPGMNGLELIGALRGMPAYRATKMLLLTTEDDASRQTAGQTVRADWTLGKPFHPDTLLGTVAQLLA